MRIAYNLIVFGVFIAALLFPAGLYLAGLRARAFEERPLVAMPAIKAERIFDPTFYKTLDEALRDKHPAREEMVKLDARLRHALTGEIPGWQVVEGKDGYLFLRETVLGGCIDPAVIQRGVSNIERLTSAMQARGIPVFVTVAPDKPAIYPDKLSPLMKEASACRDRNREVMQAAFHSSHIPYLDLFAELAQQRRSGIEVYPPGDTHWTQWGSSRFVSRIVGLISPATSIPAPRLVGSDIERPDLQRMSGLYYETEAVRVRFDRPALPNRNSSQEMHSGEGPPFIRNTSSSPPEAPLLNKRLLIIHDSFIYATQDQFAQYFSDVLLVHWTAMDEKNLASLAIAADAVIIECVEREIFNRFKDDFSDDRIARSFANAALER